MLKFINMETLSIELEDFSLEYAIQGRENCWCEHFVKYDTILFVELDQIILFNN